MTVAAPTPKGEQQLPKPSLKLDPSKTWTATVATNCGTFTITLDVKRAPKTSASFASLASRRFYDGLTFFYIYPGHLIQGGDPIGDGSGGPGYEVVEKPPRRLQYVHGVVAMAKQSDEAAWGTSGSQFWIVTGRNAKLCPEYALVGKVTKGLRIVDRIAALKTGSGSAPLNPVVISSVEIAGSEGAARRAAPPDA